MKKSFLYLIVLTLLAIMVLWLVTATDDTVEKTGVNALLLPEMSEQINAVNRVEIVTAGNTTLATLIRTGDSWQLEQMASYHADWSQLQPLLADLATAMVVESKTDKAEYYARLGVEAISLENTDSVLVRLSTGDLDSAVLVGHRAQGRTGQYVRLQNQSASALIDKELDVSTQLLDWVDSTIIDISSSEVAEVEILHPGGERVLVMRISADQTDFDLAGKPMDREIRSSWAVNSLGSVFSMLNLESVQTEGNVDWSNAVNMRLLMFSGVEIMADVIEVENQYLLRLSASHPAAKVIENQPENQHDSTARQDIEKQAQKDVAKTVESINQKTNGWVYGISKTKFDPMVKKPEDLLKPLESS